MNQRLYVGLDECRIAHVATWTGGYTVADTDEDGRTKDEGRKEGRGMPRRLRNSPKSLELAPIAMIRSP